ncbi:hypothetical protein [Pseudomonas sp. ML96]|uniref:hypothetical protein n=1 Tax=Pseudomonas sp. ML96 TaxID=1523503 RepID=UPI0005BD8FFD|nr:hypothetical protein [Pseudomonas sp. ML96]
MPRLRILSLLLILSLLGACDDKPAPPADKQTSETQVPADQPAPATETPVPAPAAPTPEPAAPAKEKPKQAPEKLPEPGSKVVDDTSLPKPADSKPKPAAKVSTREQLPPVRLDLRLPPELVEQLQPDEPFDDAAPAPLLPEMFVEKPTEPGPFELNGRLITNEREKSDNYWDSVEGAELQFKFRN